MTADEYQRYDAYLAAIKRLRECEHPGNAPQDLDEHEAEQRMRDLWTVFNFDHQN